MEKSMNELIEKLHEEGCSCVVSNKEVRTYTHRGVDDLYRLLTQEPTFLDGAEVADRVVGKAAAAILQIGLCIWPLVPGIGDSLFQPAALGWMLLIQPVPEGFQNLRCLFVPEFMPLFKSQLVVPAIPLNRKQFVTILDALHRRI